MAAGKKTKEWTPGGCFDVLLGCCTAVYTVLFIFFRGGEMAYIMEWPSFWVTLFLGYFSLVSRQVVSRNAFVLLLLGGLVFFMDVQLQPDVQPNELEGRIAVVTGGNSGTGRQTAKELVLSGATVYLGCRSKAKCQEAADAMNDAARKSGGKGRAVFVDPLDLSSLASVKAFASSLSGVEVDYLLNNAGYVPHRGAGPTIDGFESGFGSMHLGHFLLTELLLSSRPKPLKPFRVVNVASGMHYQCFTANCFHKTFWGKGVHAKSDGCSYARAKMANVLHAWALPAYHNHVTALSINLGWVGTNIQPWMKYLKPFFLIRDPKYGISPILHGLVANVPAEKNGNIVSGVLELSTPLVESTRMLQLSMEFIVKQRAQRQNQAAVPMRERNGGFDKTEAIALRDRLWDESKRLLKL
eukprot:g2673.t1